MTTQVLSFHSTQFDVIDRNQQPWLRLHQIGVALGYSRADAVNKIYQSNADEFTDSMTVLVELDTNGGKQQVRIFSLRGCHLLAMFARTAVAKEFRKWVLDVLEHHTQPAGNPAQLPEPKTKKALSGGLSLEQQDCVKALVKSRIEQLPKEKQGGAAIKCWSAIKTKFGKSYKEVEPENFSAVVSLIGRVTIEGELLAYDKPENILPINSNMPGGMKKISFQFDTTGMAHGRWAMYQQDGHFSIRVMEADEFLISSGKLPQFISDSMGGMVRYKYLPSIIKSAAERIEKAQPRQ